VNLTVNQARAMLNSIFFAVWNRVDLVKEDDMFGPNIQPPPMVSSDSNVRRFKPGIASLVLGVATIALFLIALMLFVNAATQTDPQTIFSDRDSLVNLSVPMAMILCCSPIMSLAGIGFGIMAIVKKVDKMIFGIIGLVINSLFIIGFCLFTVVSSVFS